jgi:hypothetical protein
MFATTVGSGEGQGDLLGSWRRFSYYYYRIFY